jgi:hypothetical protein
MKYIKDFLSMGPIWIISRVLVVSTISAMIILWFILLGQHYAGNDAMTFEQELFFSLNASALIVGTALLAI